MKTKILWMDTENGQEAARAAAEVLKAGGLVAFPTETVYGLGADGLNAEAAARIYEAKGRPSDNPLILHIAKTEQLDLLVTEVGSLAKALIEAFWPGPLTLIFHKSDIVPYTATGGLDTVAVRMPSHPAARMLLECAGIPIAAPSANRSGRPSPTEAGHVVEDLFGHVEMIIDGGAVGIGLESTIVDVSTPVPMILRPGYITKKMLEAVIGPVQVDPATQEPADEAVRPRAPGMKYRHYAPKAPMYVVEGEAAAVTQYINQNASEDRLHGRRAGVLTTDENRAYYEADTVISAGSRLTHGSVARNLYSALRAFDSAGVDVIYTESFAEDAFGEAVMNRLLKAAGHQRIRV